MIAPRRCAIFLLAVVEHDLRAQRRRTLALGLRGIFRHHNHRGHAEKLRRRGYPLCVIAR